VKLSEAEWKVMTVVWRRHPVSARGVLEDLPRGTDWAYTTVKTLLTRLVRKGALKETRDGVAAIYAPAVSELAARRSAVRGLVQRAFGGYAPMLHFLLQEDELSEADRKELKRLLAEGDRGRRGKPGK
jgi:BlaI family transcriptional regulator, penicillinase repressor